MSWRNLGMGVLVLGIAGCGGGPKPTPVAGDAVAPAMPGPPVAAPKMPGPPAATAQKMPGPPGATPASSAKPDAASDPAELAIPLVGPPGGMPTIVAKPVIPEPDGPEVSITIAFDPNSGFDDLSARFAKARAEQIVQGNGDPQLEQMYDAAKNTPFQGSKTAPDRLKFLKSWQEAKPEDPAPLILQAHLHIQIAWAARGSGFAGTVTQEGWETFRIELRNALTVAKAAENLNANDPEVYHLLVILAKGLGAKREHLDRYVEAGRKIFPAYYPLYCSASEYLLPRWHGEEGDCGKFADAMSTAIGGDEGLIAYARIAMTTNYYDKDMLFYEYDAKKLAAGCKLMEQKFPNATYLLNFLAINSLKSQDHAAAQKFYARLRKGQPQMRQWGQQWQYEQFKAFAEAPAVTDVADEVHWPYATGADDIAYLDGGKVFVTSPKALGEGVRLWNREDMRQPSGALRPFPDKVAELQGGGKRLMLSAGSSRDCTIVSISLDDPEDPVVYKHPGQSLGAALSPDGKTAATLREKKVHLWDPSTAQELHELPGTFDQVQMGFSPDGQRLLVTSAKSKQVFDVVEGKLLHEATPATAVDNVRVYNIDEFWDSNTLLGTGMRSDGKFRVIKWLPEQRKMIGFMRKLPQQQLKIEAVSKNFVIFSESGRGLSPALHIHRMSDGKHLRTIVGHYDLVQRVLISPNESEFATVEFRGPVRFWKLEPQGAQ